jgi:hypothetical protein|nr:MAG TPA: protein of unknown function (DUF948) [Caudoviricetes sp.]
MDMTITIVLLAVAILGLLCYLIGLRECMADLRRYNDYLERSLSDTSHYLYQQLERLKGENQVLSTQLQQMRKEQQKQD